MSLLEAQIGINGLFLNKKSCGVLIDVMKLVRDHAWVDFQGRGYAIK